ncbi:MAG: TerC family protein [Acidobacteria bacterium]|nr:TerC family protein [Acidobacteriota bacterium]
MSLFTDPAFWAALFSVTMIQVALGADNLIIITILAGKLPADQRDKAVRVGLILAMLFRLILLAGVSYILALATEPFWHVDAPMPFGGRITGDFSGKALVLILGGLVLIWKGIKELRVKAKGVEHEMKQTNDFTKVVGVIVAMNLLFSVDSILTVVGMTDVYAVMVGSVTISVAAMLWFAKPIARFISENPDFEILGLFVLLLIGFVLFLEGGHTAHLVVNGTDFPYIPQWIVIFILMLMFAVDLYQNWWDSKQETRPVRLRHREK